MRILLGYLIGREDAILAIARSRQSLWISFLFVISAGLARNYDQRDLLHEWWYLLLPIGASLVASFALFAVASTAPRNFRRGRQFFANYTTQALKLMSAHSPNDFPPHWTPPPKYLNSYGTSRLMAILDQIEVNGAAPWVRDYYVNKLVAALRRPRFARIVETEKLTEFLHRLPKGKQLYEAVMDGDKNAEDVLRGDYLKELKLHYTKKAPKRK